MQKNTLTVAALSLLLVGMATSCQKESEMISSQELSQKSLAQETSIIYYWVDGEEHYQKYVSQEEYNEIFDYLIKLAEEGHTIDIEGNNNPEYAPAKKESFKTRDREEMKEWVISMKEQGYNVRITFDSETGTYKGTATPKNPGTTTTAISTERDSDSM